MAIVSVSLTDIVRDALDTEARRQKRSRSYVVSEAIQEYIDRQRAEQFALAREQTLREGLDLTPAERVKLAEALWRELAWNYKPGAPRAVTFRTFDEYDAWRRQERVA